ncbi:MAG TPA: hypothetical protein VGJ09_02955 [Bryobacteraceae bacterium]|jgi:DNA-binding NtrC family response regulator
MEEGSFCGDLYHRLNVVALRTPPLRECREDIPLLAEHFLAHFGEPSKHLTVEASRCLEAYDWPGNVRELADAMEHAVVMGDAGPVTDLPESVWDAAPPADPGAFQASVSDAKRDLPSASGAEFGFERGREERMSSTSRWIVHRKPDSRCPYA